MPLSRPLAAALAVCFAVLSAAEAKADIPVGRCVGAAGAPAPAGGGALETVVEREVPDPHRGARRTVTRTVAVPAAGGFFTLVHVHPAGARGSASFDELVGSFKPAAK